MLRVAIVICGILLGMLLGSIGLASSHNLWTSLQYLLADPWGLVTLIDLSIGLIVIAVWIALLEPRPLCAAGWIIALFLLGNVVTLVFLLYRTRYARSFAELFLPYRQSDSRAP